MCARRRSNFLLRRQEKVTKEKATPLPVSPSPVARGQPAMLGPGVCRRTRCVLRTPLKQLRQARQRCACPSARAHPRPCASRHGQKGVGAGSIRAIASLGLWSFAALGSPGRLRPYRRQRASRAFPTPGAAAKQLPSLTPLPTPAGCAEKRRAWGGCVCRRTHALRHLACRSCLNGVRPKGERSEFCGTTPGPSIAGCPRSPDRAIGGRRLGVAFSLVTFSWRLKRKLLRRRAHIPASALNTSTQRPPTPTPCKDAAPAAPQ